MAGWNNCKHNHCPDCGCGNGEHDDYCDAEPSKNVVCPQCEKEKVNVMKAEKRVTYQVVVTMSGEDAVWIHAMLGSCNGSDNPALSLRKAIGEATGRPDDSKLVALDGVADLPLIDVRRFSKVR